MSTKQGLHAPATAPKPGSSRDPFRYGWRYVKVKRPDGTVDFDQIPLTPEDLLFPLEGDFQLHTDMHNEDCLYLKTVLKSKLTDDLAAVVLSDCRVDFNVKGLRPLGPDVVVLFGHNGPRQDWGTFHVGEEKSRPGLVVEITSPDTRKNDLGIKVKFYHQAQVPHYVVIDVRNRGGRRRLTLIGYSWTPDGYERMKHDDLGRLVLEPLGISIGTTVVEVGDRVVCFDAATDRMIGDYEQVRNALIDAEAEARNAKAEARNAEAEARNAKAEARNAEAEAAVTKVALAAETEARLVLEAKLRAMEERLKRLEE
jgi:Uma2 family endonuclease